MQFEFFVVETLHTFSRKLASGTGFGGADAKFGAMPVRAPEPERAAGTAEAHNFTNDGAVKPRVLAAARFDRQTEPEVKFGEAITLSFE